MDILEWEIKKLHNSTPLCTPVGWNDSIHRKALITDSVKVDGLMTFLDITITNERSASQPLEQQGGVCLD
jgi:hypothetical protein